MTPLHLAASKGHKDVTEVLLEAGASLSTVDKQVIKPSVKLRQSNIKPFK
jgi:ankyrin repeat protein